MECLLPYLCMVTVPHIMVGLERMLNYRGVGLERFHCITIEGIVYIYHASLGYTSVKASYNTDTRNAFYL